LAIKPTFQNGAVAAKVQEFQKRLESATIFLLQYMGEELTKYAREQHNYTDQTGNLTNSIGYAVVRNGKIVNYGGEIKSGDGAAEGLKIAQKMAANASSSFSLLIVAGMNYAAYVEAKGYNVILPAELKAKADLPAYMQKLQAMAMDKAKANAMFNL
jgi:flagellar basal body rod protein FlgG